MNFIFPSFEGNKCHLDKTKYKEKIMLTWKNKELGNKQEL